jgi:hypothetical protein
VNGSIGEITVAAMLPALVSSDAADPRSATHRFPSDIDRWTRFSRATGSSMLVPNGHSQRPNMLPC